MPVARNLYDFYQEAKANKWFNYFAIFCRVTLAVGFIVSGYVKIAGERFASGLPVNHPLGHYLEALHQTGYYYTFIGVTQLVIALLLLVPRTALLGALMYFPIMLNICVLTYATRFEGTRITTFMLLANLFLLCWDFDRIKSVLPFRSGNDRETIMKPRSEKFPIVFFGCVLAVLAAVVVINQFMYDIRPGNMVLECTNGCAGNRNPAACEKFCDCIYTRGKPLDDCLQEYSAAPDVNP